MRSDPRPMNIAERLVAGPTVLATVARRPQVGDVVVTHDLDDAFEVVKTRPAIVSGLPGLVLRNLRNGWVTEAQVRHVVVLTKVEAREVRAHYADLEANP